MKRNERKPKHGYGDSINMHLKKIFYESLYWIEVAQDMF
jgi:hypothetical protein